MLDAIEQWATDRGFWMLRETSVGSDDGGRVDAILVPMSMDADVFKFSGTKYGPDRVSHWTCRLGLLGVEVKYSRADFQRGVREGQFERYRRNCSGLYVATDEGIHTREVPPGLGHLVTRYGHATVCRRHPEYAIAPLSNEQAWKLVWAIRRMFVENEHTRQARVDGALKRIGNSAARALGALKLELDK